MTYIISKPTSEQVANDIDELKSKISQFKNGEIEEDRFKQFRLTRGVYGQRQVGVQMIRIKLPAGRLTASQLRTIADASDKYATGNLHLTTRQDIQLHFVKLEESPFLWEDLEKNEVTLREACGNTVRNVTASPEAGIDPDEPFDITPYTLNFTYFFLRNPICQEMGRKFKVAFSANEKDTAMTYFHDIGFIAKLKDGKKGFKVVIGGGLGAQPFPAQVVYDFLPVEDYISFSEAVVRVFDRHGERTRRHKARMKYLLDELGLEKFLKLVREQQATLKSQFGVELDLNLAQQDLSVLPTAPNGLKIDGKEYQDWLNTNTFEQKQKGYFGVYVRVQTGDIHSDTARALATVIEQSASDDIRVTANQGLLLRFVKEANLPYLFAELQKLGLHRPGFDSTHDITACPGSDTCNLAVTNSTGITRVLEQVLADDFAELIYNKDIKIKISGCMNACGQHNAAQIGFHGSSIKDKKSGKVAPAMQVLLGGGVTGNGEGFMGDKVIKLPTKRIPDVLKTVLEEYEEKAQSDENFNSFYQRLGKMHFYHLLKDFANTETLTDEDFVDWGGETNYTVEVGVGECAAITLDLVESVLNDSHVKLERADLGVNQKAWADSIYNSYSSMVIAAKALLLNEGFECNSHSNIIQQFDEKIAPQENNKFGSLQHLVDLMDNHIPDEDFARAFAFTARVFYVEARRIKKLSGIEKTVIVDHYKA